MIISERFKENVKWMCSSKGINYSKVEKQCHLPYGSIGSKYKFNLDDAYYIAQFFNTTVDDLMSNDYYTAALSNKIDELHKHISELENELASLQLIKESLISGNVGLPQVSKTIGDYVTKKSSNRRTMHITPDDSVVEFMNAGFFKVTGDTKDYIPTRDIYKIYSEVSPNPVDRRIFGRYMRAVIPCNATKSSKKSIDGRSTSVVYGIKVVDK